jgi:ribulose-phosphate 3-epimerase
MSVLIAPSLLAADFVNLERDIMAISSADLAHVDVMDDRFVPNITFGLPAVKRLVEMSPLPIDAHLMIDNPDRRAESYAEAGCFSVTFHAEASNAPVRLANKIRAAGARAGIAVRPATPVEPYLDFLDEFDMILIMTVEPGFGGQKLIPGTLRKVARTRAAIDEWGLDVWLQVDGGIKRDTIVRTAEAGANVFVAGTAIYKAADIPGEIAYLRGLAMDAEKSTSAQLNAMANKATAVELAGSDISELSAELAADSARKDLGSK